MSTALEIRKRLLRPANAVVDKGINLRPNKVVNDVNVEREKSPSTPCEECELLIKSCDKKRASEIAEMQKKLGRIYCFLGMSDTDIAKEISVHRIIRTVADQYKILIVDLTSNRRQSALPRMIAMYLARTMTNKSYPQIAKAFGKTDHSTPLHAVERIRTLAAVDPELDAEIKSLRKLIEDAV